MKTYIKPSLQYVELKSAETFAKGFDPSCTTRGDCAGGVRYAFYPA